MPSGYDRSPDYGGRPPLSPRRVVAVAIYVAVVALIVWLVRG
jgi:preprotein translocase subunit Sec61beta